MPIALLARSFLNESIHAVTGTEPPESGGSLSPNSVPDLYVIMSCITC